jgi:hypothetical protein
MNSDDTDMSRWDSFDHFREIYHNVQNTGRKIISKRKEGVNYTLKQTVKAQRESRSIARRYTGWVVVATPRPPYPLQRELVSIVQEVR